MSSSSILGVSTEKERRKIFGDTSRNIDFLHAERILATETHPGDTAPGVGGVSVDTPRLPGADVGSRIEEVKSSGLTPDKKNVGTLPNEELQTKQEMSAVSLRCICFMFCRQVYLLFYNV